MKKILALLFTKESYNVILYLCCDRKVLKCAHAHRNLLLLMYKYILLTILGLNAGYATCACVWSDIAKHQRYV